MQVSATLRMQSMNLRAIKAEVRLVQTSIIQLYKLAIAVTHIYIAQKQIDKRI